MKLFAFIFKILGALSPIHIWFVTIMSGAKKIGTDSLGNTYYQIKARAGYNHPRRWVVYKDVAEPSSVPPEWHGWLHYQSDYVPTSDAPSFRRSWQKPAQANLTGTSTAYHPPGHLLSGGVRDKATGDYEAWTPPSSASITSR
ncbi:MAG TPA: NADH:ubiquinone oxidoreductase subunit NDUFA12 [Alphaproteobacteria bacterium]|jgi:NADH:ubiquinone oxidoreductase subunit|nr:NADH:ubiquinone oxidoreductase subunit NDUFA12 [Alphaproteobacteria bacterium]MCB9985791.1 NADH:ubiquinone oxidoreductase subunit NDUFA12 [Micavibrio sp.]HPQ51279.1 NADH:ubiquinone oxidoreductase subunit NDUFA12 [Alphaproteobacteria bacterium]HRK97576.1 NADH:ubiquinone oxidoreductase subunit NDUFA12 [Alphaproteobacteria bacterium]